MAKLLFLGSGSAFTVGTDNFQSNMLLISDNGEKLLIDCGSDIRFSLYQAGFSYKDINHIYISHPHADHIGGLEYMGFNNKFTPGLTKPCLYLNEKLAQDLWEHSLSAGMSYTEGVETTLDSFFTIHPIGEEQHFYWQKIKLDLVKVVHVNAVTKIMYSYGLFFTVNNLKIFITSDLQFCPEVLQSKYEEADLIFHDCEISPYPSQVHPHYQNLVQLPPQIKQKMWLYGYQPIPLPPAEKDGFLGFVKRGDIFDFTKY